MHIVAAEADGRTCAPLSLFASSSSALSLFFSSSISCDNNRCHGQLQLEAKSRRWQVAQRMLCKPWHPKIASIQLQNAMPMCVKLRAYSSFNMPSNGPLLDCALNNDGQGCNRLAAADAVFYTSCG
jgi:hypothetical protein